MLRVWERFKAKDKRMGGARGGTEGGEHKRVRCREQMPSVKNKKKKIALFANSEKKCKCLGWWKRFVARDKRRRGRERAKKEEQGEEAEKSECVIDG